MKKNLVLKSIISIFLASTMFSNVFASSVPANNNLKYQVTEKTDGTTKYYLVKNPNNGATLSYSKDGGIKLIEEQDGKFIYAFKDMNKNGKLDIFEDWRKDAETRSKDLASKMTKEQIAGLMLFSSHEFNIDEGINQKQKNYLRSDHVRNVLNAAGNNVEKAVIWNNQMQAYVESIVSEGTPVIPVNFSSDPRNNAKSNDNYSLGVDISKWPSNLGLAATFDANVVKKFANMASEEYRAMGITTALGPQIDLATEPRWLRVGGTFGENSDLTTDMTRAYADGSQSTYINNKDMGWGENSINVMVKHFPGDGSGEGGRESHCVSGKFAVFPGNNFSEHMKPFIDGAMKLNGKTEKSASVMSSYSVGIASDGSALVGEKVASAYNKEKMDYLREENNYDGVICTDWGVTSDVASDFKDPSKFGMAYGVEQLTSAERHFEILKGGTDMFGGNNDKTPVLEAYDLWEADFKSGKLPISAKERFEQSGKRITKMIIQAKVFENPFLDIENSKAVVASEDKVKAGYKAQLDSIVMLKNSNNTIKSANVLEDYKDKVVYIPSTITKNFAHPFRGELGTTYSTTMDVKIAESYFKEVVTDIAVKDAKGTIIGFKTPDLKDVDMAIIGMRSIDNGHTFNNSGLNIEDGTFYPLSLQYRKYIADGSNVRKTSIAGDVLEDGTIQNRSYFGKSSVIANEYDLDAFENTVKAVKKTNKNIPIIVAMKADNPVIMKEFEKDADAIVVGFSVSDQALFEIILGEQEPNGLLPIQFPADMDTVEAQFEDVSHDMTPYKDSEGNLYDFAYGLNYKGVINDIRTMRYK